MAADSGARAGDGESGITGKPPVTVKRGRTRRLLAAASALAIGAVILAGSLGACGTPGAAPVLSVDGKAISRDYFLRRVRLSGDEPEAVLRQITYELIVGKVADTYGLEVTPSEVDSALRAAARGGNAGEGEAGFQQWYTQKLESTGMSDREYREIVRLDLLAVRMRELLASTIPSTAEQVHLLVMTLDTYEEAVAAINRLYAGESFSTVAGEVSVDQMSKQTNGDLGWIPRGVTPYDDVVFGLEVGRVSQPVQLDEAASGSGQYAVFLVKEKEPARQIESYLVQVLGYRKFYQWIEDEKQRHDIRDNYDAEAEAWLKEQLGAPAAN